MSATTTVSRRPASGSLAEVVDIILDKGLVIDAYVRVSLVGIELLTVDVRVVIASVDTYLHFAEATNRLDLRGQAEEYDSDLNDLLGGMTESVSAGKTSGAIEGGVDKLRDMFTSDDEEEAEAEAENES
ncbi:gas vesicle protein GvpJ [Egicoccus halophilus]|uniref:Gas vesicle protein A n=1 Tax=Egicoccus halophilus TaxID=1670830 RepID=A0A8J3A866_9ACTN|nr:gas vesicle protein GvpJ [Egicoccus halophilus]GGI03837.1 hypothetical protein GCM10011354_06040 [Egicoccus halophilus]